jgi:hypothetical protein
MSNKFRVAGIGSRKISQHEQQLLFKLGAYIAKRNWTLSSGNALGSDEWFGRGVNSVNPQNLVLYLPWASYNEHLLDFDNWVTSEIKPEWLEEAKKHHGRWEALKQGGQKMMGRNIGIAYKANVCLAVLNHSKASLGGTGCGWRYCERHNVPRLDISKKGEQGFDKICDFLNINYEAFVSTSHSV